MGRGVQGSNVLSTNFVKVGQEKEDRQTVQY